VDKRINIRAEDIETNIKYKIEGQLPLDERVVTMAVNQGVPYVLGDKNGLLTQATVALGNQLLKSLNPAEQKAEAPVKSGFFSR
jgi:hypothetical protein